MKKEMVLRAAFALFLMIILAGVSTSAFACDFCLVSQGISPLETQRGTGIKLNQRYARLRRVYSGTDEFKDPAVTNPKPLEEYWTTELTGFHAVTDALTLLVTVPMKKNTLRGHLHVMPDNTAEVHTDVKGDVTGLGDMSLIARYALVKMSSLDSDTALALVGGVKLPTGRTDAKTSDGAEYLDAHLQPGSGSFDYIAGLSFNRVWGRFALGANALASITTAGEAGASEHRFGHTLNYDVTPKYRVYGGSSTPGGTHAFLALGVNGEVRQRERLDGEAVKNSGGHTAYLSPGVMVAVGSHWIFEMQYQQPVYHNLYGIQTGENFKVSGGAAYLF